jgi:hypothetical protein
MTILKITMPLFTRNSAQATGCGTIPLSDNKWQNLSPISFPNRHGLGLVLSLLILCLVPLSAQSSISFSGYAKNFLVLYRYTDTGFAKILGLSDQTDFGADNQRIRLVTNYSPSHWLFFNGAYDFSLRVQDPVLFRISPFFSAINPYEYRVSDPDRLLYPVNPAPTTSFGIFQNLDRFNARISLPLADIYVGRQAIAWGSARVINPTDVIAPFTYDELDTEDRIGVDAARWRMPLGSLGEFDTGYVFGRDWKFANSAFFIRTKVYRWNTDISVIMLGFRQNLLLGLDVARSIGGAGFWCETAYVLADQLKKEPDADAQNYLRLSTGLDYNLTSKMYGFVEYHFNGAGESKPENYYRDFVKIAYREGSVYLLGRHYLTPGMTYQLSGLLTFTAQSLMNLLDPSLYLALSLDYNIAENIYVAGGAFVGAGKKSRNLLLQSEFGSYPNVYYTSFRIYF